MRMLGAAAGLVHDAATCNWLRYQPYIPWVPFWPQLHLPCPCLQRKREKGVIMSCVLGMHRRSQRSLDGVSILSP